MSDCLLSDSRDVGCILGAFVGDAAGAVLEFDHHITEQSVQHALTMPGGGVFRVGPGQVTDDSEMALAMFSVLASPVSRGPAFPADAVREAYIEWHRSGPFDCGMTIGAAMSGERSATSQSNGALMRCCPIPLWARSHRLPAQVAAAAVADADITHDNATVRAASAAYAVAVHHLLCNAGDAEGAVAVARATLVEMGDASTCAWLEEAVAAGPYPPSAEVALEIARTKIGWVRWGFTLAFRCLSRRMGFEEGITMTLRLRGDTDTNACIVGCMLGALHGQEGIPQHMANAVLASAAQPTYRSRPAQYDPSKVVPWPQGMLRSSP